MNKPTILLWKHSSLTNSYTLKIDNNRYIGLIRTDRNGESYWKFREFTEKNANADDNNPDSALKKDKELEKVNYEQPLNQPQPTNFTKTVS